MSGAVGGGAGRGRARLLARVGLLALVAWPVVAWASARALIVRDAPARADAIAVLGGSSTYVERARLAARLYAEGRAPVLLLTDDGQRGGWSVAEQRNPRFVELAAEELRRAGVPPERIEVVTPSAAGTFEEAALLRQYAEGRGLHSVAVVTSGYHSRRALWTLRRAFAGSGVEVGVEPVEPGEQSPRAAVWWLYPLGWQLVAGEYVKLIYYRLRH
ncbi:MAG: YdcF family protein [Pyrinomonadaceae bacterium]